MEVGVIRVALLSPRVLVVLVEVQAETILLRELEQQTKVMLAQQVAAELAVGGVAVLAALA